ncbi:MAG: N-6 DNA methylase, partial [Acidobacteriota bacterium]
MAGEGEMIAGFGGDLISHAYLEERGLVSIDATPAGFAGAIVGWWRRTVRSIGPASSARAVCDVAVLPLLDLLQHDRPAMMTAAFGVHGRLRSANGVVLVVPWVLRPAAAWKDAVTAGITVAAAWAVITNGRSLRIVDCTRPWSRAAIEFDFERLVMSPRGVAAIWALASRAAMTGAVPSLRSRVAESDAHASRVCASLSDGVLDALPRLAAALSAGTAARLSHAAALDQSLTLVYRILFLLFAEARALVPMWNEIYREGYTISALTDRAMQPGAAGLWPALQAISRLAHAGCNAGELTVTAFNGRLFSPRHAPLVEQRRIPDDVIREVLLSLGTESTRQGRRRISYHDLGVEQLGSVYERVLDYEPAANRHSAPLSRTSTKRKSTGSFYTPLALTDFLVRRTLAPLVEGRSSDQILSLRIVDPSMGSGAFLVSACHFLADGCELAMIRDGEWFESDATPSHRATLRRNVAERCLYGVDLNPTAVQLARLSLWLTTLAADRPLTFLDHHLACGNSLVGARLEDLSTPLAPPRSRKTNPSLPLLDSLIEGEVASQVLPARLRLAIEPSNSLDAVKSKERALAELALPDGAIGRLTAAADAWCAARLWPGSPPSPGLVSEWIAAATGSATSLPPARLRLSLAEARAIAATHGVFHWQLAFPEVFLDQRGHPAADAGFDAVIGNPPWDMLRADTGSSAERSSARSSTTSLLRFCRSSQYRHQGHGHPNSYQLFVERGLQLTKPGGRVGLILPSGIATDHGSAALRHRLFDRTTIDAWLEFDNRARIFPIHRSMRFVVLATTNAGSTDTLRFRAGLIDPETIDRDAAAPLAISRARLEAWSPEHLTVPSITNAT